LYCRRKHDAMMPHNLFSLVTDRLMLHSSGITLATYNVLLEVCTTAVLDEIQFLQE